jgi:hypothetical protein
LKFNCTPINIKGFQNGLQYSYQIKKYYLEFELNLVKIFLTLSLLIGSVFVHALENEDYYNRQFCKEESGQAEYRLPDLSRIDCLTDTHAFEADWADGLKVYESIGQSLYYAAETGKQPGILLLIRKNDSDKHIRKVRRVIERWKLPIKLVIIDVRNN